MQTEDDYLKYAQENVHQFISDLIGDKKPSARRDAIFMAGSPGAGKTELAESLKDSYDNLIIIDADYFRTKFGDYTGENSSHFQKATSWLVEQAFQFIVRHGYSFILDATFAVASAEKKVVRALKNDYMATIFYVYQDPKIAWSYTKERMGRGQSRAEVSLYQCYFLIQNKC